MTNPFDTDSLPTCEPTSIVKGDYAGWRRKIDYDDTIKYDFYAVADRANTFSVTGTQDGAYWVFELLSAATSAIPSTGEYFWELTFVRDSDSEEIVTERGYVNVFETTSDRRSHPEVMLGKIESILENRADADVESYSIGSRSLTKMSVEDLIKWREYYKAEIARSGGSTMNNSPKKNTVLARFV